MTENKGVFSKPIVFSDVTEGLCSIETGISSLGLSILSAFSVETGEISSLGLSMLPAFSVVSNLSVQTAGKQKLVKNRDHETPYGQRGRCRKT